MATWLLIEFCWFPQENFFRKFTLALIFVMGLRLSARGYSREGTFTWVSLVLAVVASIIIWKKAPEVRALSNNLKMATRGGHMEDDSKDDSVALPKSHSSNELHELHHRSHHHDKSSS
mmetsp:Transcript_34341/g.53571  ORF Transcript_34341/g.53571 Transcript_34341/m.53571 type:complete len:118 (+) Transcript_34341:432-785(+)